MTDDYGRVAVQRGPLVYALEQTDQNGIAIADVFLKASNAFSVDYRKDFLGGVAALKVPGLVAERSMETNRFISLLQAEEPRPKRMVTLTFIPYYAIGSRENTPMEVWVPLSRSDPLFVRQRPEVLLTAGAGFSLPLKSAPETV